MTPEQREQRIRLLRSQIKALTHAAKLCIDELVLLDAVDRAAAAHLVGQARPRRPRQRQRLTLVK